jgi:hypothetical protein
LTKIYSSLSDETDILAPKFDGWFNFTNGEDISKWFGDKDLNKYEFALRDAGIKYEYDLLEFYEAGSQYKKGWVLRFKTKQAKLAFLIKWS